MKSKAILTVLILLSQLVSKSQIRGTVIIGAIATDGILIVADSRACIVGPNNELVAYIDSVPKLTLLNSQYPIALAGKSTLGDKFYINIINDFNNTEQIEKDISQSFVDFREYLLNLSPHLGASFVGGGYYNNAPYLFDFSDSTKHAGQDAFIFNHPELAPYLKKYADSLVSCERLIKILPPIIYDFAKDSKKEYEIGGPIAIIKITLGNKIEWVQNNFLFKQPKDYNTLVDLIENGKIKITPVVENGIIKAIDGMKSNPKYIH